MELLQGEAFDDLFRSFERTAFHLELQDSYQTPEEAGPFDLFLRGEPDDFAWHQAWLELVRVASQAGKGITRVRVVSVPTVPIPVGAWRSLPSTLRRVKTFGCCRAT